MDYKDDNIKDNLKRRPRRVQETIDDSVNTIIGTGQQDSLRNISNVSNPVSSGVTGAASIAQIERVVDKVNYGQRELEKMKRMGDSFVYKTAMQTFDDVKGWFGKKPVRARDAFQLFEFQQQNVRELNALLANMTSMYTGDVEYTRNELDNIVMMTSKESTKKNDYERNVIPPVVQHFEEAKELLKSVDKNKDPDAYYDALQKVIKNKRDGRKTRFEYVVTAMSKSHHDEQIENLMLQEELFETMLYGVMNMAVQTELYQRTLDNNIKIWKPIGDISKAVSSVSDGVNVLAQFNQLLNQSYIDTVRGVAAIIDSHPGTQMIINTNDDLRTLVADVNSSQYRQAEQFVR